MAVLGAAATVGAGAGAVTLDGASIPLNIAEIGGWGLCVVVVGFGLFALVKGWVIVKLHYDTLLARAEKAEEANAKLSERQLILTETNATLVRTIEKNTAVGDTVTRVMNAIQEARITSGGTS